MPAYLQCNEVLHYNQVDKQCHKDDQEGDVEDGIFNERSHNLLTDTEVTGQHVGLAQWKDDPERVEGREGGRETHFKNYNSLEIYKT